MIIQAFVRNCFLFLQFYLKLIWLNICLYIFLKNLFLLQKQSIYALMKKKTYRYIYPDLSESDLFQIRNHCDIIDFLDFLFRCPRPLFCTNRPLNSQLNNFSRVTVWSSADNVKKPVTTIRKLSSGINGGNLLVSNRKSFIM